jgi:hypothetical protein
MKLFRLHALLIYRKTVESTQSQKQIPRIQQPQFAHLNYKVVNNTNYEVVPATVFSLLTASFQESE